MNGLGREFFSNLSAIPNVVGPCQCPRPNGRATFLDYSGKPRVWQQMSHLMEECSRRRDPKQKMLFFWTSPVEILWPTGSKVDTFQWNKWGRLVRQGETVLQILWTHAIKAFKDNGQKQTDSQCSLCNNCVTCAPEASPKIVFYTSFSNRR